MGGADIGSNPIALLNSFQKKRLVGMWALKGLANGLGGVPFDKELTKRRLGKRVAI